MSYGPRKLAPKLRLPLGGMGRQAANPRPFFGEATPAGGDAVCACLREMPPT